MKTPVIRSWWQTILGGIAAFVFSSNTAAAELYFRECDAALESPSFERLKTFYARNKNEPRPDNCFRLNRNEFLVTVTDAPRISQGLYYYDASADSFDLVDNQSRPNIKIRREFIGGGQKRYVLIKSSNLHNGSWSYSYEVLFLTSGKRRQSFVLMELLSGNEDPESGFCGSRLPQTATRIADFHVSEEGGANVRIEFAVEEEDCKTRTKRKYVRVFQPRESGFTEIK
jgi:hypothetical protein